MKLLVITDTDSPENEIEQICGLFGAGLYRLHVRKPGFSARKMEEFILAIPAKYRGRLILHSHHGLAVKYRLKGIHLTETDRKSGFSSFLKYYKYRIFNKKLTISTSFHSLKEMQKESRGYDYGIFSPVFNSISKSGHKSKYSLSVISAGLSKTRFHVYALGGVTDTNLSACADAGFYGAAVLGYIWHSDDPIASFKIIHEKCRSTQQQSA